MVLKTDGPQNRWSSKPMVLKTDGPQNRWSSKPMVLKTDGPQNRWSSKPTTEDKDVDCLSSRFDAMVITQVANPEVWGSNPGLDRLRIFMV